jgi:hypothetical protein
MEGEFEERVFANDIDLINEALAWSLILFIGILIGLLLFWTMEPGWMYLAITLFFTSAISIMLWLKWFPGRPSHIGLSRRSIDVYFRSGKLRQISWDEVQKVKMIVEEDPGVLLDPVLVYFIKIRPLTKRAWLYLKDGKRYEVTAQIGEAIQLSYYSLGGRWAL